jgi:hypothetical protein
MQRCVKEKAPVEEVGNRSSEEPAEHEVVVPEVDPVDEDWGCQNS